MVDGNTITRQHPYLNENWRAQGWSHYLEWFFGLLLTALETAEETDGVVEIAEAGYLARERQLDEKSVH